VVIDEFAQHFHLRVGRHFLDFGDELLCETMFDHRFVHDVVVDCLGTAG
jgi:hypothetical protein